MSKRAISFSNSEIAISFWIVGFICTMVAMKLIWNLFVVAPLGEFILIMFLLIISAVFYFMGASWLAFIISKYNYNLLIDKITNPDYTGWIRFTRNKNIRFNIVKKGPLGQIKGMANGVKADIINRGDYTLTLPNGNRVLLKHDLLNNNINLNDNLGWKLIKKHFGMVGFKAWEKCLSDGKTLFKIDKGEKQ